MCQNVNHDFSKKVTLLCFFKTPQKNFPQSRPKLVFLAPKLLPKLSKSVSFFMSIFSKSCGPIHVCYFYAKTVFNAGIILKTFLYGYFWHVRFMMFIFGVFSRGLIKRDFSSKNHSKTHPIFDTFSVFCKNFGRPTPRFKKTLFHFLTFFVFLELKPPLLCQYRWTPILRKRIDFHQKTCKNFAEFLSICPFAHCTQNRPKSSF